MDPSLKQAAVEAVQEACTPRSWQLGRKLFEDGLVERVGDRGVEEQVFRVWAPGRPVAPTAILYVEDEEWDCDCPSRLDACEHAAAAAHALAAGPQAAPASDAKGVQLGYRLQTRRGGLVLQRVWITSDGEAPVEQRLAARKAGVQGGFSPREHDIKIDQLLTATRDQLLPLETLPSLFGWLEQSDQVQLDGTSVKVSSNAPRYRASLAASGGGYDLKIEAPVALAASTPASALVADGVAKVGDSLYALTHLKLVGPRLAQLPIERHFEGDEVVELVSELLPQLQKGMDFDGSGVKLPRLVEGMPVELELELRVRGDRLELVGAVTYGEPPVAWLRGERLSVEGSRWPKRNRRAEAQAANRLRTRFEIEPGERRIARGPAAVELAGRLRAYKGRLIGRAQLKRFGQTLTPRMRSAGPGGGEVALEFVAGEHEVAAKDVLAAWAEGSRGLALPGGGWAELPAEFMREQSERLLAFVAAREAHPQLPAHALGAVADLCEALACPLPPAFEKLRPLVQGFDGLPATALPTALTATLRSYQRRGVDWLAFARRAGLGAMLCDDMGLGKTLQALCAVEGPTLIVAPRSLLHNWAKEAARFRPDLEVLTYHGPGRRLPDPKNAGAAQLVITSYGVMRLDIDRLRERQWSMVALDEAQTIKNPDSQVARAAFELNAEFKVTLSGTPVENRLDELWSQAHFTNPGMLGAREDFVQDYARPIAAGDEGRAAALRARLRPVLLRRLKREVAPELPPRIEVTVHCELSDDERALYDSLRLQARAEVESMLEGGKGIMSALETLLRLRQAACHQALVPGQASDDSAKLRRLRAELEEAVAAGHKALVFSQWTSLLDLVEPGLQGLGVDFCRLDGSTRDRGAVVDAFSAPDGPPVMLLSLMAGGTGLNLVAADHVYFLDPWWNPAVEAQAADRAHRIGQDKPVIIHRLVARNTVDERILDLQERKRALAEAVVAEGGGTLTREDLFALLA